MDTLEINLGDRVKDPITKFQGVVVCITYWIYGCIRIGVQQEKVDKDKKLPDISHFDYPQLKLIKKKIHDAIDPVPVSTQEAPRLRMTATGGPARESKGFQR